jgi:hypothetical protein
MNTTSFASAPATITLATLTLALVFGGFTQAQGLDTQAASTQAAPNLPVQVPTSILLDDKNLNTVYFSNVEANELELTLPPNITLAAPPQPLGTGALVLLRAEPGLQPGTYPLVWRSRLQAGVISLSLPERLDLRVQGPSSAFGQFTLRISNQGNSDTSFDLRAVGEGGLGNIVLEPSRLNLPRGQTAELRVSYEGAGGSVTLRRADGALLAIVRDARPRPPKPPSLEGSISTGGTFVTLAAGAVAPAALLSAQIGNTATSLSGLGVQLAYTPGGDSKTRLEGNFNLAGQQLAGWRLGYQGRDSDEPLTIEAGTIGTSLGLVPLGGGSAPLAPAMFGAAFGFRSPTFDVDLGAGLWNDSPQLAARAGAKFGIVAVSTSLSLRGLEPALSFGITTPNLGARASWTDKGGWRYGADGRIALGGLGNLRADLDYHLPTSTFTGSVGYNVALATWADLGLGLGSSFTPDKASRFSSSASLRLGPASFSLGLEDLVLKSAVGSVALGSGSIYAGWSGKFYGGLRQNFDWLALRWNLDLQANSEQRRVGISLEAPGAWSLSFNASDIPFAISFAGNLPFSLPLAASDGKLTLQVQDRKGRPLPAEVCLATVCLATDSQGRLSSNWPATMVEVSLKADSLPPGLRAPAPQTLRVLPGGSVTTTLVAEGTPPVTLHVCAFLDDNDNKQLDKGETVLAGGLGVLDSNNLPFSRMLSGESRFYLTPGRYRLSFQPSERLLGWQAPSAVTVDLPEESQEVSVLFPYRKLTEATPREPLSLSTEPAVARAGERVQVTVQASGAMAMMVQGVALSESAPGIWSGVVMVPTEANRLLLLKMTARYSDEFVEQDFPLIIIR